MLHHGTVEPTTFSLLKKLMVLPELNNFSLVGGTCLALKYGHRLSVDLDFFSTIDFDNQSLIQTLESNFPDFIYKNVPQAIGVFGFIGDIKIDFVKHHHFKLIEEPIIEDGIRMFGDKDIMAMKIFAIIQRAQKKDFWDVAELLKKYTIEDFIKAYDEKYPSNQMLISIPFALTYFEDADKSENPISLKGQTWESVKNTIQQQVNEYLK